MIRKFTITNFKSIDKINLELSSFNCFVGMNGSGKSTILQAIDFAAQVLQGTVNEWLATRGWNIKDLTNKNSRNRNIELELEFQFYEDLFVKWVGKFDPRTLKCIYEMFHPMREGINDVSNHNGRTLRIAGKSIDIIWEFEGSILSSLSSLTPIPDYMQLLREFATGVSSLELLSPLTLRKKSRPASGKIGIGGERLSGFLSNISLLDKEKINKTLTNFYPNLNKFEIKTLVGGWKHLAFDEKYSNNIIKTLAEHTNDGMLRILAIVTQIQTENTSLILLDEIENGVNQEIMNKLVHYLTKCNLQVIATSHSPLFLNYLEDQIAKDGIFFTYRKKNGSLGVKKFFEIIDNPEMLDYAGPGEVFVNTDLVALRDKIWRIEELSEEEKEEENIL